VSRRTTVVVLLCILALAASIAPGAQQRRGAEPPAGPAIHLDPNEVAKQMTSSHDEVVDVNNESTLVKYLKAFEAAQLPEDRQQIVAELTDFCIQRGLRPSPDAAEMFVAAGLEARAKGQSSDFAQLCRYAESFDPEHPLVHLALADSARRDKGIFSAAFGYEVVAAFFLAFKDLDSRWIALSNLALWLRVTSILILAIFSLVLLAKYQAQLRHDIQEWLGGGENQLVLWAGVVGIFLPSLIFLAGYWWIVYWAGVFMLYARWPERIATLMAIALFVGSGSFAVYCQQEAFLSMSQPEASNLRCYANRIGVGLDATLSTHMQPGDDLQRTYTYLLASRYLLHGSYVKSDSLFRSLLTNGADDASVHNNLGCILFYENRYQEAIQQFSKAAELKPDLAIAYLNRSLAETKLFDFTGAQEDSDKARGLDKTLFRGSKLKQAEDWGPVPVWLPLELTRGIALKLETGRPGSLTGTLQLSGSPVVRALRPAFSLWAVLFWLIFVGLALWKRSGFSAHACFKCGRPFCQRCKTSLEFESFCSQCVHLFIKQDGVSPEARLKKNYEVEQYNKVQRIERGVLSIVAPGAGHLFEGRPFAALFILFLWCGCIGGLALAAYALPFTFPPLVGTGALRAAASAVAILLMVLIWVGFGLPMALRREPPRFGQVARG
jgi:tetratricopeptide (TPR) repeat protein